jgi:long-chain fatty acid transport protein
MMPLIVFSIGIIHSYIDRGGHAQMKRISQLVLGILLPFVMVGETLAVGSAGIGNDVLSARALGQGGVSVAGVTGDPMLTYANPAALPSLAGTQLTLGGTFENLNGKYEGSSASSKMNSNAVAPNFAVTQSFMDGKMGAGVALASQYGLETHWPGDPNAPLRYLATNSSLHIIDITPSVGYRVLPSLSFGVGADYFNVTTASLEKNVNANNVNNAILVSQGLAPAFAGLQDADSKLKGTAASWGYHAGFKYEPTDQHAFGLVYHSRVKLNINGSVEISNLSGAAAQAVFGGSRYETSAYTDLYLPQNIQLGYAYKPTEKWQLELDAAWFDSSTNKDLNVRTPAATAGQAALLANGNPKPLNWRNTWNIETGANYKCNDHLQLRGGFYYEPWVIPESAFSPELPDLSRYGLAIGAGYAFSSSISLDLAYNAVFEHNRSINNNVGFNSTGDPTVTANGVYKNFSNLVAMNLNYRFGSSK